MIKSYCQPGARQLLVLLLYFSQKKALVNVQILLVYVAGELGIHAMRVKYNVQLHDDVIKWKHFLCYWPFVRGIQRPPVNSPHKGQWRGALMFSFICVWINGWVNNREAGDLRRYRAHYDVIVTYKSPQRQLHISESKQDLNDSLIVRGTEGKHYATLVLCNPMVITPKLVNEVVIN